MEEYISYIEVFIFTAGGVLFVFGSLLASWLIRPKVPHQAKDISYECGEEPVGTAWFQFNIRFYVVALIFIIFDVELALVFPIASIYKRFVTGETSQGLALFFFVEMFVFLGILFVGLVYVWAKGDLSWVRPELKGKMGRRETARGAPRAERAQSVGD